MYYSFLFFFSAQDGFLQTILTAARIGGNGAFSHVMQQTITTGKQSVFSR